MPDKWGNIEMSPVKNRHGEFQTTIAHLLLTQNPDGVVVTERAIETSENVKVPDVAWTSNPEICVEIISSNNMLEEQMYKGQLYFQAGAEEFWICDARGGMRFFGVAGPLERSRLCPEFPSQLEFRRRS